MSNKIKFIIIIIGIGIVLSFVLTGDYNQTNKHALGLNVSVDDISVGEKPNVWVKTNESINDYVTVKLKFRDSDFVIADTRLKLVDGEGNLTIGTLMPKGNYSIVANFSDDDKFIDANETIDFSVKSYCFSMIHKKTYMLNNYILH